jgi:His/Glu/Gln/Arg/opine family amino acid ABC transporter permease subunit
VLEYTVVLAQSLWVNLALTAGCIVLGTLGAVAVAAALYSPIRSVRLTARTYTEVFLALPVLVIMLWLYFAGPSAGLRLSNYWSVVIGMALSLSGFAGHIIHGGLVRIPRRQVETAYLTGMSGSRVFFRILLPQAMKATLPALLTQFITAYKLSTLAAWIAVPDVLGHAQRLNQQRFETLPIYTALAVLFIVTTVPLNYVVRRLESVRD